MPLWGKNDAASNSTIYAAAQVNKTPNTANRATLFGNTTANAFITGQTVGQFGVSDDEVAANRRISHAGWVLRTEGSGGRAGRIQYETLVALSSMTGDASDDTDFPDFGLFILTQPSNSTANSTNDDIATFSVVANSNPTGATITYQWQSWNGSAFANLTNAGAYSNVTTTTLSVLANTASNGEIYRVAISASAANTILSSNAVLTVTA